jgi:hypothetical protein
MRHPFNCHLLYDIDLFGKDPELYYKGRNKKSTLVGRIFTILYVLIYLAFFSYKLYRMLIKVDVTFYQTTAYTGEVPSIHLTNEIFYGGFALSNGQTLQPFIDETIYSIDVQFRTGQRNNNVWNWKVQRIELEICKLSKFNPKYYDIFKDKPLENMYCPKEIDVILQGHTTYDVYSYFYVGFYPCVNTTTRQNCKPPEVIDRYLKNTYVIFKMQDIELTPQIYSTPIQLRGKEVNSPASKNLFQNINAYFQIVDIETDNDVVGFEGLSIVKKEKYLKYDGPIVLSRLIDDYSEYKPGQALCDVSIQLTEQVLTITRTYTKLIEVLGDVGGLMEVIFMAFKIISTLIIDLLYEKSMVNNLFEFDLDKRLVIIKELKIKKRRRSTIIKDKEIPIEDIKIYDFHRDSIKMPKIKNINDEIIIQTRNKLNIEDNILKSDNKLNSEVSINKLPKRRGRRIKSKMKIENNIFGTKDLSINNINYIKSSNLNSIEDRREEIIQTDKNNLSKLKETKTKNQKSEKRNIIYRIKVNKCCICFFFLCTKRKKNVQNILLNEGMLLITQNSDIVNIFNKIYRNGKIEDTIKNHTLKMSDECANRLVEFNKRNKKMQDI